jgi:hypothetical protein
MKRKEENRSVIEPSCTFFKPNKINCLLSDGTDVDGTAKYRRARTESLEYLSELSFHHARESVTGI